MSKRENSHASVANRMINLKGSTGMAAVFAAAVGFTAFAADQAQAQELCSSYTIVAGDTLSQIASRAELPGGFQTLFNANSNVLSNPNVVEIGQVLAIPCADGSLPSSTARVTPASTAPAPTTSEPDRALRVVTASGYAPFTDEALPGGGLFTQLVLRAFELGNPDQDVNFFFVNDWGSQLDSLLPSGAVDMVFPWFKPDCTRVEVLSQPNAFRCTDFNHSDPFYDALVGFYTLNGSAYDGATEYAQLMGARMCRPEAWFTFDLEAESLIEPAITLTRAPTQDGCWELLKAGEVDVVTYDALPAEEDYTELGMANDIVAIEALTSKQTLHVFVSKDNKFANDALPIINVGLEELRLSGEWFTIVREGIKATIEN